MSTSEELQALLASYERLASFTRDEQRRQKLLEVMVNIRSLLADQEKSDHRETSEERSSH